MTLLINETYTKVCTVCGVCKPLLCFYKSKRGKRGRHAQCIQCMRTKMNKQARNRPSSAKTESERRKRLRKKYNLNWSDYQTMLKACHHKCTICGNKAVLGVDHDHETGKVRGLLCNNCNTGLGHFRDNPALLRQAMYYLLTHSP